MAFRILALEGLGIGEKILLMLISIIALLPALTFHEWSHGFMAYKLGDRTAKADGRLSLNPLDHLDPIGSLMMFFIGFGWAKPVPVNTRNFKKPRRDMALVSLAGPLSNFILAFIANILAVTVDQIALKFDYDVHYVLTGGMPFGYTALLVLYIILDYAVTLNIGLGLFNLIPIPPLDGSNIVMCILPQKAAMHYSKIRFYTRYIFLGLILLTWLPWPFNMVYNILLSPLTYSRIGLANLFQWAAEHIVIPFFEFI